VPSSCPVGRSRWCIQRRCCRGAWAAPGSHIRTGRASPCRSRQSIPRSSGRASRLAPRSLRTNAPGCRRPPLRCRYLRDRLCRLPRRLRRRHHPTRRPRCRRPHRSAPTSRLLRHRHSRDATSRPCHHTQTSLRSAPRRSPSAPRPRVEAVRVEAVRAEAISRKAGAHRARSPFETHPAYVGLGSSSPEIE